MLVGYLLDALEFLQKDRKRAVIFSLLLFGFVSAVFGLLEQFIIALLVVTSAVIAFFIGQFELKKFGIELVTFTTVLSGFLYGPLVGMVVGAFLITVHLILAKSLGSCVLYCIPTMAVVGLLAGYAVAGGWFGGDIVMVGIILSLVYNLITAGLGTIVLGDFFNELLWSGTNFALNFVLFLKIAPAVLSILV